MLVALPLGGRRGTVPFFRHIWGYSTPHKDSPMNSNIIVIALLQFMLVCLPLVGQAAALGQDEDSDQLLDISRELFQDCIKQRDSLRVRSHRVELPRDRVRIHAKLQQGDLLQELLTPEVIRHGSIQMTKVGGKSQIIGHGNNPQESWLLKEFTAASALP